MDAAGRHPHFVSPLFGHASLAEALAAGRASNRTVLLVVGRQSCGGSRALVEKTISKAQHVRTPLCLYVSPDGELMHATSGGRPPAVFLSELLEAPHRRHGVARANSRGD